MRKRISLKSAKTWFPVFALTLAPEGKNTVALGMIVTDTSIAMIVGLPLGRTIGLYMTWWMTFVNIAVTALLITLFLGMVFPKLPPADDAVSVVGTVPQQGVDKHLCVYPADDYNPLYGI